MAGIGEAIGLQDKPNLFASQAAGTLARLSAEEAAANAAARKAQDKKDAETKKLFSDEDIFFSKNKFHNYNEGAARADYADTLSKIAETKEQYPNDYLGRIQGDMQSLNARLAQYKNTSDYLFDLEKAAKDGKHLIDPDFLSKINKENFSRDMYRDENGLMVSKKYATVLPNDKYGVSGDGKGRFGGVPVAVFDYKKAIEDFNKNPNNWTETGQKFSPVKGVPNVFEKKTTAEVNLVARESFINALTNDPNFIRYWGATNGDQINEKDPVRYSQLLTDHAKQSLRESVSGKREILDSLHAAPPKPPKAAKAKVPSLDASFDDLKDAITETDTFSAPIGDQVGRKDELEKLRAQVKEDETYKVEPNEKAAVDARKKKLAELEKGYGEEGNTDLRYSYPTTLKTANQPTVVSLGPDVIDLKTNRPPKESNQLKFIPRKIGILKVKGEWKPYVFGESYDKTSATDSNGDVRSDQSVSGDFAIPLNKVEGFLNQQGTPTKWVSEALQKLKSSSKPAAKAAEKKKPDNTGKPKQVKQNGVTYILNEETGEYE